MITYVFLGALAAAVALPLLFGYLHQLANRTRRSGFITPETTQPRLHTDQERWDDTFDLRNPDTVLIVERQIDRDLDRLDAIERGLHTSLHKVWTDLCTTLHLDPIDIEWAQLQELTTV